MSISIVKPEISHTAAISAICTAGWKQTVEGKLSETFQEENVAKWYNYARVENDILSESYTHVALFDSEVVGVIGGGITAPETGELFVLYVKEAHRYKGIGRQLLDALTRRQIEKGAKEQWVSVQEENQYGIPFYEARGFIYQEKKETPTSTGERQISLRYKRKV
ncbi:GNAT family N-acetyltransferase [Oceanobacillus manasiensis]|uniref:GNAT family N-acetyltransferase n=1 Tax=Oceanobacillus manasiensis TaxID=586413 RepID=UPI0005A629F2|nr:GNAT family N-acetyltransferase [Oceanobacillus manasiensis]